MCWVIFAQDLSVKLFPCLFHLGLAGQCQLADQRKVFLIWQFCKPCGKLCQSSENVPSSSQWCSDVLCLCIIFFFLRSDCCCAFLVDHEGTTFTLAHSSETCMCPDAFTFRQMEQPRLLFCQISHGYFLFVCLFLKICAVQHSGKSSSISASLSPCSLLSSQLSV